MPISKKTRARCKRFFAIIAVYVFVGPIIGLVISFVWVLPAMVSYLRNITDLLTVFPRLLLFAYVLGAPAALAAGAIYAALAVFFRRSGYVEAIVAALAAQVVALVYPRGGQISIIELVFLSLVPSLVGTLTCAAIARRWLIDANDDRPPSNSPGLAPGTGATTPFPGS